MHPVSGKGPDIEVRRSFSPHVGLESAQALARYRNGPTDRDDASTVQIKLQTLYVGREEITVDARHECERGSRRAKQRIGRPHALFDARSQFRRMELHLLTILPFDITN